MKISKFYKKIISLCIIVAIVLPSFIITNKVIISEKNSKYIDYSKEDKQIAADISNITGSKTEDILNLKKQDNSWNEVLDLLKRDKESSSGRIQSGIDKDLIENLKKIGNNEKDINEAISIIERLEVQLNEISSKSENQISKDNVKPISNNVEDFLNEEKSESEIDLKPYIDLLNKFDKKKALSLMLKLKKSFGTFEKVLDEYLLALQIDINLELFIGDQKEYEKEKNEKIGKITPDSIISIEKIEKVGLDLFKNSNKQTKQKESNNQVDITKQSSTNSDLENLINKNDFQKQDIPKPQDPLNDVMKEINDIKNQTYIGR